MKKSKSMSIKTQLTFIAVLPVTFAIVITLIVARNALQSGMEQEVLDGLKLCAEATKAGYDNLDIGDYVIGSTGDFYKGNTNLTIQMDKIDSFTAGSDADVTVCYGKTRIMTSLVDKDTGERIVGTDVSDQVWDVVQTGEVYTTTDIVINEQDYAAAYVPLKNGNVVIGMVFAGRPTAAIDEFVSSKVNMTITIGVVIVVMVAVVGVYVSNKLAKGIQGAAKSLQVLSEGDLTIAIDKRVLSRGDELGDMARAQSTLIEKLREIVSELQQSASVLFESGNSIDHMAGESSTAADEISRAVEDISKGAVSQAEDIETASVEIATIGDVIADIMDNVGSLTNTSDTMSEAGNVSQQTMHELTESNDRTVAAIAHIADQILKTNEAVEQIRNSASLITAIADETNLLSLNASIESARAGEAGRGFAVVASEIQKLSTQSRDTAAEIQGIIDTLIEEATKTQEVMNEADGLIKEQQAKLDATRNHFEEVSSGISVSREDTFKIRGSADNCDSAKAQVADVMSNLSAISQENAASAEQTTASMEELNANINLLAGSAGQLKELAENLNEQMKFFRL